MEGPGADFSLHSSGSQLLEHGPWLSHLRGETLRAPASRGRSQRLWGTNVLVHLCEVGTPGSSPMTCCRRASVSSSRARFWGTWFTFSVWDFRLFPIFCPEVTSCVKRDLFSLWLFSAGHSMLRKKKICQIYYNNMVLIHWKAKVWETEKLQSNVIGSADQSKTDLSPPFYLLVPLFFSFGCESSHDRLTTPTPFLQLLSHSFPPKWAPIMGAKNDILHVLLRWGSLQLEAKGHGLCSAITECFGNGHSTCPPGTGLDHITWTR